MRIARTKQDLLAACRVRALSYGHHLPQMYEMMLEPDLLDADENTVVVLCVDKASGAAVGSARFQTNVGGPLLIEHSVSVPASIQTDSRAEITRLSAVAGSDPLVRIALMKASYLFCAASQIRWMVICARKESLIRQYRRLGFVDIFDDGQLVPMRHVGRLEHKVLLLNVTAVERTWLDAKHALYDFFFDTSHPDIQLFSTKPALPARDPMRMPAIAPFGVMAPRVSSQSTASSRPALIN
ncbi:MAG: hypothetical protein M3Z16_10590 [Pseudomonadota bacterium]|nr:hypothetical protein [Pseudomonadota bacterium]